ncbi:MAG: hypothetical protein EON48_10250 [Acetobacteraceae bacterium]|nr:MAG: hypothetical protein EON48_10250 [Acetobacteraceae bacterium]
MNGKLDSEAHDLIAAILRRGGVEAFEISAVSGGVQGYVIDRPMTGGDALAPLLASLGLRTAERNGKISILGDPEATCELSGAAMALPDDGQAIRTDRRLDARAATARVRFIDGARDYQTGSVLVRQSGDGGAIDLDLPAVCGPELAKAAAERALNDDAAVRARVTVGPLEALALEPGDKVTVEGLVGEWCVTGVETAEQAAVTLEPTRGVTGDVDDTVPTPTLGGVVVGAPFFRMIDLPPLPGAEEDGRPLAVVAADPWGFMQVRAGPSPEAMTVRADVEHPASVATLLARLSPGTLHRWDHANALMVRIEGVAPHSQTDTAILAGGNAAVVETAAGWELIQFRRAEFVGNDVWRLSELLRGQQGTEAAMRAGAPAGAAMVFLGDEGQRASAPRAERGLPIIWRAGLAGLSGGPGVAEVEWASVGAHDRPFSPAHLRVRRASDGGRGLNWIARARIGGDNWDVDDPVAPPNFRIRIIHDGVVVRTGDVDGCQANYSAAEMFADFPDGVPTGVIVEIAQWGEGYGWGQAAVGTL